MTPDNTSNTMMTEVITQGIGEGNVFFNLLEVSLKTCGRKFLSSDDCRLLVAFMTKVDFNQFLSH